MSVTLSRLAAFFAFALAASSVALADVPVSILNVSYDPTRELYAALNPVFVHYWKKRTGQTVEVHQSHGGSGAQARAVINGLEADVVTLALAYDIDAIAKAGLTATNWQSRLPDDSSPYTSTIVLVVRHGNPKHIRDWNDLARPGVGVITANPKTSGGARWNFLAAWGYASRRFHGNDSQIRAFVGAIYHNAVTLDTGSRGATDSFAERGLGDVLIAWENEAILLTRTYPGTYQVIVPSISILAEPTVALVDANVRKHHTEAVSRGYLQFLYSPAAQKIEADNGFRPTLASAYTRTRTHFVKVRLFTIEHDFGGWEQAQARFFSDGGVFDQIYQGH